MFRGSDCKALHEALNWPNVDISYRVQAQSLYYLYTSVLWASNGVVGF